MNFKHFLGIDVSKNTFDLALKKENHLFDHICFTNNKKRLKELFSFLKTENIDLTQSLICIEHTGIYGHLILDTLYAKKANIWLEHALTIKRSLGIQRGKNDKTDAIRIAEYAFRFTDKCKLWQPDRQEIKTLKALISLRVRLIKTKKLLKAPLIEIKDIKAVGFESLFKLTNPAITKIEEQIKKTEEQIERLIKSDAHLYRLQEIITSVDGVGKVTAWQMIVNTNEFKNFNNSRKFACYSGVVPFEYSSGISISRRAKVSNLANKRMKELLHMSALSATVTKGELNTYYKRKVEEGKNKMLVLNNIRNKIVQRIFSCIKENRKYEKSYTNSLV